LLSIRVQVVNEVSYDLNLSAVEVVLDLSAQEVVDFIVLEVMACSTTTTGDVLRSFHDILRGKATEKRLKYGINFRQVVSRTSVVT